MKIKEIKENKKQFLPLLLLADEQEDMINRYLDKGTMYVLDDDGVKCECVVTDEGNGILEIKNIATEPEYQGKGYGKALIDFVATTYKGEYSTLQVGTGDSPSTIPFYEKCGFIRSHSIKDFFTDNYDHPIYEAGTQLIDMIYLQKKYKSSLQRYYTDGNEQNLVAALRKSKSFIPELSLVAVEDEKIVGHILFTKAVVQGVEVLALAPLSVLPDYQNRGIGLSLMKEGHSIAHKLGYEYSVVLGHSKYYPKAGYIPASECGIKAPFEVDDESFMALNLNGSQNKLNGVIEYDKAIGI